MKFSIVIPTQDRAVLLAVVVKYAMQLDYADFEVIVSDNSTTNENKQLNIQAVSDFIAKSNFRLIYPPRVLSPPEHFEFALDFASGDYVIYLTDKMAILPYTLSDVEAAIESTGADIVNWAFAPFTIDDVKNPAGSGTLVEEIDFLRGKPETYDANKALHFKASCEKPRNHQTTREYILGKIVFGCYSKALIDKIRKKSGTLFVGATHDYSAMIQALSMAKNCVALNTYGVVFLSLPRDQSLGSLTDTDSQAALRYFKSFSSSGTVLAELLIPELYSSQHNMVAHDYKKYLPLYDKAQYFDISNWVLAIHADLISESKIWSDSEEKTNQLNLFWNYVETAGLKTHVVLKQKEFSSVKTRKKLMGTVAAYLARWRILSVVRRILPKPEQQRYQVFSTRYLEEAIRLISDHSGRSSKT